MLFIEYQVFRPAAIAHTFPLQTHRRRLPCPAYFSTRQYPFPVILLPTLSACSSLRDIFSVKRFPHPHLYRLRGPLAISSLKKENMHTYQQDRTLACSMAGASAVGQTSCSIPSGPWRRVARLSCGILLFSRVVNTSHSQDQRRCTFFGH